MDLREQPGTLVTPEAVLLEFSIAGLVTRMWAKILDLLLLMFCVFAGVMVIAMFGRVFGEGVARIGISLVIALMLLGLPATVEWWFRGRTPGKALTGIRVLSVQGGPITFRQALLRNLLMLVEVPTMFGLLLMVANRDAQRFGDFAAGTMVVKDDRSYQRSLTPTLFLPPVGWWEYVRRVDVSRLTNEEFVMLRSFLLRNAAMKAQVRGALAERIAVLLDRRLGGRRPSAPTEDFLVAVASAYQLREGTLTLEQIAADEFNMRGGLASRPNFVQSSPNA